MKFFLLSFVMLFFITGCAVSSGYKIDDCVMPNNVNAVGKILKIVSVQKDHYIVFTSLLSSGRLVLAEDYVKREVSDLNNNFSKVACPKYDGTFSPDKFLNSGEKQ